MDDFFYISCFQSMQDLSFSRPVPQLEPSNLSPIPANAFNNPLYIPGGRTSKTFDLSARGTSILYASFQKISASTPSDLLPPVGINPDL